MHSFRWSEKKWKKISTNRKKILDGKISEKIFKIWGLIIGAYSNKTNCVCTKFGFGSKILNFS